MKKNIIAIAIIATLIAAFFALMDCVDKYDNRLIAEKEFGTVYYSQENAEVRGRRMDYDGVYYQIYVCWWEDGVMKDYQKLGVYEADEMNLAINHAVEYCQANFD